MNVLTTLKSFGKRNGDSKVKFLGLTAELERSGGMEPSETRCGLLVDSVVKLRNMLGSGNVALSKNEKERVLLLINALKVRTFLHGTPQTFATFRALDSISNDMERML